MTQKFIRSLAIKIKLGDETAVITCRPMTRGAALALKSLDFKNDESLLKSFDTFIASIEKVEGLTDAAGQSITREDFVDNAFFIGPLTHAMREWVQETVPKNSDPSDR